MRLLTSVVVLGGLVLTLAPAHLRAEHPSNGWIVFASDRQDSRHEIYLMEADGSNVTRLTTTGARMPMWSPDSRWIAYETVPQERTRIMRWDGSEDHEIFDGVPRFWLWDGTRIVCMDASDNLHRVDPETGSSSLWLSKSEFSHMASRSWSPSGLTSDGRWLVTWTDRYRNGYTGTNGTFDAYHSAVILDVNNKGDVFFFGSGCEPTTPPSGDWVYHVCGGTYCAWPPDVYRMRVADRNDRSSYQEEVAHDDPDMGHEYFPRVSNDNTWLTYGATDGCHDHDTCNYEIYIHRRAAGSANRERLTNNSVNDQWPHLYVGDLWSASQPQLAVSPGSLSFGATSGGANPAAQDTSVSNSGSGTLDDVSTTENAGWLTVNRSGSGNSQTLTNVVDIAGLTDGIYSTTVEVAAANAANSPQSYDVILVLSEEPLLSTIEVVAANDTILAGRSVDLTAYPRDQLDAPFAADISWSVSAGGGMAPASSGGAVTQHTSTFTSDGTAGTVTVTASSGGVQGTADIVVSSVALPIRINCGSNDYDLNGWERDDAFVSGGSDFVNPDDVDTTGVTGAAPAEVYKSVRHVSPHDYDIPVADGEYLLRLHFADAYSDRSMDYFAEGTQILDNFDIVTEAGGPNLALVREFSIQVADGNGLQIEARSDGDVFEAGIEVQAVINAPPAVEAGANIAVELGQPCPLQGSASDDGLPAGNLDILWSKASGPGDVTFANSTNPTTTADFTMVGNYTLELWASDGALESTDTVQVNVVETGEPVITLIAPDGGEVWYVGEMQSVQWTAVNVNAVVLRYSTDYGSTWTEVAPQVLRGSPEWGNYPWRIPDTPSSECLLRVLDFAGQTDVQSQSPFEIASRVDGGVQPDGGSGGDSGVNPADEIVIVGGCGCGGVYHPGFRGGGVYRPGAAGWSWILLLFVPLLVRRKR